MTSGAKEVWETIGLVALAILGVLGVIVLFLVVTVGFSALFGFMFWLIWSYAAVPVFNAPEMTFLQAWGIWFLVVMVLRLVGKARSRTVVVKQ